MKFKMLRHAALVEGTTLVLLVLIAVPLKHLAGIPEFVSFMGPIHGVSFLVYLAMLTMFLTANRITITNWGIGLIAAFIPFGSFIFERKVLRQKND